jgi:hypothetical protein
MADRFKVTVPREIEALMRAGIWPRNPAEVTAQNLRALVPQDLVRRIAPEENEIIFYSPPFVTVRAEMGPGSYWCNPNCAVNEIDPDRTALIGDFGLGSDAPIALAYRNELAEPSVIRLRWGREGNHWVEVAPNVRAFVMALFPDFDFKEGSIE